MSRCIIDCMFYCSASSWSPSDSGSPRYGRGGSQEDLRFSPHDTQRRVPPTNHLEYHEREFDRDGFSEHGGRCEDRGSGKPYPFHLNPLSLRGDERRASRRHPLEHDPGRSSPSGGRHEDFVMRRAVVSDGYLKRNDTWRDPRLHRNGGEALRLLQPVNSVQIMDEHSYCQRKTLWRSELDPLTKSSEKIVPTPQQVNGSCFLSIAPKGPQSRRPLSTELSLIQKPAVDCKQTSEIQPKSASSPVSPDIKGWAGMPEVKEMETPPHSTPVKSEGCLPVESLTFGQYLSREGLPKETRPFSLLPEENRVCDFTLDLDTESESEDELHLLEESSLVVSLPNSRLAVPKEGVASLSSKHAPELRVKLEKGSEDSLPSTSGTLKLMLKQFPSNQIRLRNGRVLPPSTLAIYASRKGPRGDQDSSPSPSPEEEGGNESLLVSSDFEDVMEYREEEEKEEDPPESDDSSFEAPISAPSADGRSGNPGTGKRSLRRGKRKRRKTKFLVSCGAFVASIPGYVIPLKMGCYCSITLCYYWDMSVK